MTTFAKSRILSAVWILLGLGISSVFQTEQVQGQAAGPDAEAASWTQLRGTTGTARASRGARPAVEIDLESQARWRVAIPGEGWSSPVYERDLIWMTTSIKKPATAEAIAEKLKGDRLASIKTLAASVELRAIAVDQRTGKLVHNRLLKSLDDPDPINPMNSYASPTPVIRAGRVICHFGTYGTWCLDAVSGQTLWESAYKIKHSVGPGSSPVIFEDRVILVCDGTEQQFVVALDYKTGKEVWKTDRPPIRALDGEQRKAYSTPILIEVEGRRQVVVPGAQWLCSYELSSGKELWRFDHGSGFSVTPMPVFDSGLVIFSTGYMRPEFVAVDPSGAGDVTETHLKWRVRGAPTMPSFVTDAGRLYSVNDKGILVCIDIKTGDVLNRKRLGGNYSSSPILAAGNLYVGNRDGELKVVKCSVDLETIATTKFDGSIMATPVLIEDDLLIRTSKELVRISPEKR